MTTALVSTPERIVAAAADLAQQQEWERVSYSAIAERAGMSRPTLYAYFPSRQELYERVLATVAGDITHRVVSRATTARTGADFVVEITAACILEFRENPTTSAIGLVRPGGVLAPSSLAVTASFLGPLVEREPQLEPQLEEIAETLIRFLLSFVMFESDRTSTPQALREYLRRRLVPALGLGDSSHNNGTEDT
jgi:AcrR family transcriptional regulator